ncbi:hypothetical protein [Stenotrophomonas sp. C1657]|uniref:hypothetical protein n=1 Tax=Stenotrophomonas sp. C1657 TaxID=3077844 RepID=UPI00293D0C58|nr:hypothetical protein [Stenotrophomonas sp. C1657]MDV3516956.1 hypothetical protein [Stenotrophomonas sp. C1657]
MTCTVIRTACLVHRYPHYMADAPMEHLRVRTDTLGVAHQFGCTYRVHARQAHHDLGRQQVQAVHGIARERHRYVARVAESAVLIGDGGGIVTSFLKPMVGGARIAQLLYAPHLRRRDQLRMEPSMITGRLELLRYFDDVQESAMAFDTNGEQIVQILPPDPRHAWMWLPSCTAKPRMAWLYRRAFHPASIQ